MREFAASATAGSVSSKILRATGTIVNQAEKVIRTGDGSVAAVLLREKAALRQPPDRSAMIA